MRLLCEMLRGLHLCALSHTTTAFDSSFSCRVLSFRFRCYWLRCQRKPYSRLLLPAPHSVRGTPFFAPPEKKLSKASRRTPIAGSLQSLLLYCGCALVLW